ncbi:aminoglycoside phosphotransferase family protein [Jannaschia donghaensis]|uniref:Aminoglycoside/hydroxyurea antibiotic resistance kinase n=1 Tax=Jannaschia donghaensis TaxID=420998 RepID=A0A0M6YHM5_9RHOB|nr:aminoglycoside phosphotransferase family protein [Jannaschia donghaensis]CTQ49858.1 Aminoglycoside/hydroxyurea antibiotic resistance kinase [Jannaschia donghaensis]
MNQIGAPPPTEILSDFGVFDPVAVSSNRSAQIWKVRLDAGGFGALKIYAVPDMGNERSGFAYLAALPDGAAAKVVRTRRNVALLRWLEEPSLGDRFRDGHCADADGALGRIARRLGQDIPQSLVLPPLAPWFADLTGLRLSTARSAAFRQAIARAVRLADDLINTQTAIGPLHGDLHHDNVIATPDGDMAFDAKGILGERTFELANAFRNPKGVPKLRGDRQLIEQRADRWHRDLDVDRGRLLAWAAAKCALSIVWTLDGSSSDEADLPHLRALLDAAER